MSSKMEDGGDIESSDGVVSGDCQGMERGQHQSFMDKDDSAGLGVPLLRKRTMNTTSQIAIIGANTCPIESLDYEIIENDLFKQDWRSRKKSQIYQYVFLKWIFALLIGLGTGFVGFFNNLAVENIAGFKMFLMNELLHAQRYNMAFFAYVGYNLILAAVAATICAYIAPAAAGSGIPEVKAYLNGIDSDTILAPSTLFVKVFGSIGAVSAGFILGKEGPMVHTGACIASLLGQGGSRKYHLTWSGLRYFKNDRDRRDLITCGAAAGVAAAFRAPVGGVLFALEEAASWWRSALLWRTFFTTAVVAVVLRGFISYCQGGRCGYFGKGGLIIFDLGSNPAIYNTVDIIAILILGVIAGILGGLYNFLMDKTLRSYSIINEKGAPFKILLTIFISVLTSCCSYGLPWLAKCTPCPESLKDQCPTVYKSGNFRKFQCPPGHYNDLATLFFNTNDVAIRNLFSGGTGDEFHLTTLLVHFVSIYFLGLVTYGIAVPSGLFIPVILAGASYGRFMGTLLDPISNLDPGLFALLGSAAFLGGTMRMTVSVCVIILELTNDLIMLPLIMLVILVSKTVADNFNKGVYDQIVTMKGLPYIEAHAEPYMRNLVAGDVVAGPLVTFSGVEKVGTIMGALTWTQHNGFPVVDEPPFSEAPELCGLVLRSHLLVLLKGGKFTKERVATGPYELFKRFGSFDFAKAGSGKGMKLSDLKITEVEMEMYVDLHPITNTSPYTVVETMSLAKAAVLFRGLGLRHLCVVPKTPGRPPIVGILTRHDFMPEHVLGLFPHLNHHK